jgi:hypothetical protein
VPRVASHLTGTLLAEDKAVINENMPGSWHTIGFLLPRKEMHHINCQAFGTLGAEGAHFYETVIFVIFNKNWSDQKSFKTYEEAPSNTVLTVPDLCGIAALLRLSVREDSLPAHQSTQG